MANDRGTVRAGEAATVGTSSTADEGASVDTRFAWLTLLLAAWILAGLASIRYALDNGLANDVLVSIYHIPFYLAIVATGLTCVAVVLRAQREGRGWRHAFPAGYGVVGAGLLLLLAWPVVEIGWREGVGLKDDSAEQFLSPSRLMLFFGALLIASAPLRAALVTEKARVAAWPAVVSAALVFTIVSVLAFLPAASPFVEAPRNEPVANAEIWVMNSDGSHQTRLMEAVDGFAFSNAVWSPDGSQIAYNRFEVPEQSGVPVDDQAIWVASADGTNQHLLVEGTGWYWLPHWSPDGQWVVYTIDGQRGPGAAAGPVAPAFGFGQAPAFGQAPSVAPNVDVWRIRVDGTGAPERLTDDPADDRAGVYSPDGRRLLFDSSRADGATALFVVDADGSNPVRATSFGDDWGGTWAPDGTRIAFHANPAVGPYDIYVVPYPGSAGPIRLTDDPAGDFTPAWSPDGSRIAFVSDRGDGDSDIWSIAADGSDPQNLSRTPGATEWFTSGGGEWGPDGRIVYERSQDASAIADSGVRENLGIWSILLGALVLAILVLAVVRVGPPPFGAVALITGLASAFAALGNGEWRFVVAAVIGGLIVDFLIRLAPAHLKPAVAGAGSAAALVLGAGVTVIATTGMAWTPTLLLGVALVAAAMGWALAGVIAPGKRLEAEVAGE
jgi:Tol biopolymer transport system component